MSFLVFLIAAVPAAFVAWVGNNSTSRAALWGAAILAALLGIFTGNPMFVGVDLLGVAIGLYIGHIQQTRLLRKLETQAPAPVMAPKSMPQTPRSLESAPAQKKNSGSLAWLVVPIALFVAYENLKKPSVPLPPVQQQPVISIPQAPPVVTSMPKPQPNSDLPQPKAQPNASPGFSEPYQATAKSKSVTSDSRKIESSPSIVHKGAGDPNKAAYKISLRQIEARHPELNPDSASYRVDLVEQAVKLKNEYVAQGYELDAALVQAVAFMEQNSVFSAQPREKAARAVELDPGGHSGFDPKCRWLTSQDWTCK